MSDDLAQDALKQTVGEELASTVAKMHGELVRHLVETYCNDDEDDEQHENPVAVMFAAALVCRSFLDARLQMMENGDVHPDKVVIERALCLAIMQDDGITGLPAIGPNATKH